jgi:SAM-dependent methyltransferase
VFFCAPGEWAMYRCSGCGGAYLDPRPTSESIGRAYQSYYTHVAEDGAPPPTGRFGRLKRAMGNGYLNSRYNFDLRPALSWGRWVIVFLPRRQCRSDREVRHLALDRPRSRILDIGCGNGAFVKQALAWGWDAEGLDPDPNAASVGRNLGLRITTGSLPKTGYPDGSFAAVTMSHCIEHLHEAEASLREICRILQPGGVVWIATPNVNSNGHRVFGKDWRGLEPPRHLVLFTSEALAAALARAGFEQVRQVRSWFCSQWYFRMSYSVKRGENPLPPQGSRLPWWLKVKADLADWQAFFQPQYGEEIVFVARVPSSAKPERKVYPEISAVSVS